MDNSSPSNNVIFMVMIGVIIGRSIGNNKIGSMKFLFLTYIENAEIIVPQTDKSNVGIIKPIKI